MPGRHSATSMTPTTDGTVCLPVYCRNVARDHVVVVLVTVIALGRGSALAGYAYGADVMGQRKRDQRL